MYLIVILLSEGREEIIGSSDFFGMRDFGVLKCCVYLIR